MRKRILSLCLSVVLCLPCFVFTVSAAPTGRIDGVDYGRIEENVSLRHKVEFDIGNRRFEGYLQNGKTLSEDDVDKIIKQVMNEMEITSGVLRYSEDIIRKAAKNKGFNPEVVLELGAKLALDATGLDKMVDLYDVATGKKDVPDAVAGYVIGHSVSTICEKYIAGIPGMVIKALWNSGDIVARETARMLEESKIAQQALERTFLLNLFYDNCNRRIEAEEKSRGMDTWSIVCNQTVWCQTTLFDIPVIQYWKLSCDLTRSDNLYGDRDDPTNYGGVYRGTMVIDVWHDLSNFDEQFQSEIFMKFPFAKIWNRFVNYQDEYSASSLTKQLICTDVEIHLDQRNMTSSGMTEYFMLKDFSDTSAFNMKHDIKGPFDFFVFQNGKWHETYYGDGGSATVDYNEHINNYFGGSLVMGNRYPQIIWKQWEQINNGYLVITPYIGRYGDFNYDQSQTHNYPITTDYKIFEDLNQGRGMLTVVGK